MQQQKSCNSFLTTPPASQRITHISTTLFPSPLPFPLRSPPPRYILVVCFRSRYTNQSAFPKSERRALIDPGWICEGFTFQCKGCMSVSV